MQPEEALGRLPGGDALLEDREDSDFEEPAVSETPTLLNSRVLHRALAGFGLLALFAGAAAIYGTRGGGLAKMEMSSAVFLASGDNASAGTNKTDYNDEDKYPNGHDDCPCVGILGRPGEYYYPYGDRNVTTDHGSYCNTWDLKNDHCQDNSHSLCHSKWCYVDPCKCKGLEQPPKPYADLNFQGKPAYWSYVTCGHSLEWDESVHGSFKELQEEADKACKAPLDEKKYGKKECQCRGFSGMQGKLPYDDAGGDAFMGEADTGSYCKAWDKAQNPQCLYLPVLGEEAKNATFPEWCDKPWCYVDPCQCDIKAIGAEPQPSMFDAVYATSGAPLYWSYAACGVENAYSDARKMPADLCDPENLKNKLDAATIKATGSAPSLQARLGLGLLLFGVMIQLVSP